MPANLIEYEEDTAFERYVVERAAPLMPRAAGRSVIELGEANSTSVAVGAQPATVHVTFLDGTGSSGDQLGPDDIRPLIFGAAWKILDQLIELGLESIGTPHDRKTDYSIGLKVREARQGNVVPVPPFDARPHLWTPIMNCYASAESLRNSLVHRRLRVDRTTGVMEAVTRPGESATKVLTQAEQSAFCQVAEGVASAVINRTLSNRRAGQLGWALDQLSSLHGQAQFGIPPLQGVIPVVIVRPTPAPSGELTLDFAELAARAKAAVSGVSHYDLEIHLPDGRVLAGPLEEAPSELRTFSVDDPPDWLRWA
jgi:hypothetical protein